MNNNISVIILTKNEEKNIDRCFESVSWCNNIILIDDYSIDKTREIAESRGVTVIQHKLNNDFAQQRNFGLQKANTEWVLFIDADETVPPPLAQEIVRRVSDTKAQGFYLPRQEMFYGNKLKCADKPANNWSFGPNKLLRLARKNSGRWTGKVHEIWEIEGKVETLNNSLLHYSFPNLTTALKKINKYSSLRAVELKDNNKKINLFDILVFPFAKFIKDFLWHLGFLDVTSGLIYCLLMSLHSFLVRAKLWHLNQGK